MSTTDVVNPSAHLSEALEHVDLKSPLHMMAGRIKKHFKKAAFSSSGGMLVAGQHKFLTHEFPDSFTKKFPQLEVIFLSDVQYGHNECRVDKLIEYRDWIAAEPNRFCIFGGDMVDGWRVGSPGPGYDNWCQPSSQVFQFCELMAPIRHKILGSVGGNHERRGQAGGVDLGKLISFILEIPYSEGAQMISLKYGKHTQETQQLGQFDIYAWHGSGAAASPGGRVNMTLKAVPNDEAKMYFSGHIHHPHVWPNWRTRRDHKRQKMWHEKYYVVSASHFLNFYGTYAEVFGATYTGLMMPVALIFADGRYRVEI